MTSHDPRSGSRVPFALAAVGLGVVAGLLVLEVALRAFDVHPPRSGAPDWYVIPDDAPADGAQWPRPEHPRPHKRPSPYRSLGVTSGEFVPGVRIRMVYPSNPRGYFDEGNGIAFRINHHGLRGPEVTLEKPPGTIRVLGLGDSFTFGEGVREDDTFLRRLEHSFRERYEGRPRFEFLNAGVGGYNTFDEVLYFDRKWRKLSPDVVLIVFFLNDAYTHKTIMEMGEDVGANLAPPPGLAQWSYVWDNVQHSLATRRQAQRIEEFYRQGFFQKPEESLTDPGSRPTDWPKSRAGLERAAEIARSEDLALGLVLFPMLYELDHEYPFEEVHRSVAGVAGEIGIPVLDLLPAFRGRKAKDLWVSPGDHHPNERAHEIAADAIEPFLDELLASRLGDGAWADGPGPRSGGPAKEVVTPRSGGTSP